MDIRWNVHVTCRSLERKGFTRMEAATIRGQIFIPECCKSLNRKAGSGQPNYSNFRFPPYFTPSSQLSSESLSNFITRLVFQRGFGREHLSIETREMLLYGQLQEGLLYTLSVSDAQNYRELCLATKGKSKDWLGLRRNRNTWRLNHKQVVVLLASQLLQTRTGRKEITGNQYGKPKNQSD